MAKKKRLEILERDGWECRACLEKEKTLHVHHIFYLPRMDPWDIPSGLLITLCKDCHRSGPCSEEYKSCDECPDFKNDCKGPSNLGLDLVYQMGQLLNLIWTQKNALGRESSTAISNAIYILKG